MIVPSGAGSAIRGVRCPADELRYKRLRGRPATGIPPDIGPRFFCARMATEQSGYRHLRFAAEPVPVLLAPRDARKNADECQKTRKAPDAMTTDDEITALILQLIWAGCGGCIDAAPADKVFRHQHETITKDLGRLGELFPRLERKQLASLAVIAGLFERANARDV